MTSSLSERSADASDPDFDAVVSGGDSGSGSDADAGGGAGAAVYSVLGRNPYAPLLVRGVQPAWTTKDGWIDQAES